MKNARPAHTFPAVRAEDASIRSIWETTSGMMAPTGQRLVKNRNYYYLKYLLFCVFA